MITRFDFNNLAELAKKIHQANAAKGFWDNPRSAKECFSLVQSELYEAMEGQRKSKFTKPNTYGEYIVNQNPSIQSALEKLKKDNPTLTENQIISGDYSIEIANYKVFFQNNVKDTFEDEIADAAIRVLDLVGFFRPNFHLEYIGKNLEYNSKNVSGDFLSNIWDLQRKAANTLEPYFLRGIKNRIVGNDTIIETANIYWSFCWAVADFFKFDLHTHIEMKLLFNSTRPYKHGKTF